MTDLSPPGTFTIIRIAPFGRAANLMGQLMFAEDLKRRCRQPIRIEGYDLPEWSLYSPASATPSQGVSIGSHLTRIGLVAKMIDCFKPKLIDFDGLTWRCGNFSHHLAYNKIFPQRDDIAAHVPDDHLLIHIRAGDVSTHAHMSYGPLPISYYRYLVETTKLTPIFIGELAESDYFRKLRREFPDAGMIGGASAIHDFATIRGARNVAIAVSTFSWLATYLSSSTRTIHVPIAGHFDPSLRPDSDLLPIGDERYVFYRVDRRAWERRYEDPIGSLGDFSVADGKHIRRLKRRAAIKTGLTSARIHLGLLRRIMTGNCR